MKASCSLWSADLLALNAAIQILSGRADEFHLDLMDGNCVPDILFGLDFVAAMRAVTSTPLDVHLMTRTNADWIERTWRLARLGGDSRRFLRGRTRGA
jgi:ribulose-phosphate 3-epimerase